MSELAPTGSLWPTGMIWIVLTVILYLGARRLQALAGGSPLLNPVLTASVPVVVFLWAGGVGVESYQSGGQYILWLLGPATTALAVPFVQNLRQVRPVLLPLLLALGAGSATAVISAVGLAHVLGADAQSVASLVPKSVTTPIAMGIAGQMGGWPVLTAGLVIVTGMIGAVAGGPVLTLMGVRDARVRGLALGVAAHGIGTARAFQESRITGTFAGVATTLNGIVSALILPLVWS